MSLRTRLRRLEQRAGGVEGYPACRERRGWVVLRRLQQMPDSTVVADKEGPSPCARCGQIPEQIIEVVECVVDAATETSALEAPT